MFDNILIKTPEQIEGIRAACRDAALVLDYIEPFVKAGVTTEYLDDLMLRYTEDVLKDKSACLNYDPDGTLSLIHISFPKSLPSWSESRAGSRTSLHDTGVQCR